MPRLPSTVLALTLAGCAAGTGLSTPVADCTDAEFAGARLASAVDTPPEPIGGLQAVQDRVRIPNEGMRVASPTGRYAVVRAVVDTSGAVRCTEVLDAGSGPKGEAARRALHRSAFTPGRDGGTPVPVVLDVQLDVRGDGRPAILRGDQIRG